MNEQETIDDIIAEKRLRAAEMEKTLGDQHSFVESLKNDADRIEAAWKREIDVLKQRCAELNAEVAAKDEVIKRLNDAIAEEQRRKSTLRNCDKYNTTQSATRKWAEMTGASIYAEGDGNDWRKFFFWLYAIAKEGVAK